MATTATPPVSDPDRDARAATRAGLLAATAVERLYRAARGRPPGWRPQHARGKVFSGVFTPSGALAGLTRARHLTDGPSPIVVRLSNGSSDPATPDTTAGILGFALRFTVNGAPGHDLVASNLRGFATREADGFVRLAEILGAVDPSARGIRRIANSAATAARFVGFLLRHPESGPSMRAVGQLRPPVSFATTSFEGIHAYLLVNEQGARTPFRFRIEPHDGEAALLRQDTTPPRQYLMSELEARLAHRAAVFSLILQIGEAGDRTDDPTKRWPPTRREIVAGHVSIIGVAANADTEERTVFDPTRVPDGVELSDDRVLRFRGHVYRLSALRRQAGR